MAPPTAAGLRVHREAIAVAGGTLPVAVTGEGPPLMLLHGWTLDHRMWAPQIAGLAHDFMLIMPDRRGHGRATAPPDLAHEAGDVIAIAGALGLDRFALAGLSQGALVALDAARRFPERITGLIVSGAPLPALVEREEALDLGRYRDLAAAGDMAAMRELWARHPLMQARSPAARALLAEMLADYDGRDLLAASNAPDLSAASLRELAMPVLAVTGEHDTPWRRACAVALGQTAPNARHSLIAGAGHLANADNSFAFNAAITAFLADCNDPQTRPL